MAILCQDLIEVILYFKSCEIRVYSKFSSREAYPKESRIQACLGGSVIRSCRHLPGDLGIDSPHESLLAYRDKCPTHPSS
jgi:hypothetical protein